MRRNGMFSTTENIDYSPSTVKTFGGKKLFLLILSSLAAVSDFISMIIFAVAGYGGIIAVPILLLVLDALFIVGICFSNFRFKYALGIWISYILFAVILLSFISMTGSDRYVVMTTAAIAVNTLAHIVLFAAIIFAGIFPLLKSSKKIKAVMIAVTAAAAIAMFAFTVFFSINGYFGQGFVAEYRVVKYQYQEKGDCYIAYSIEPGRGRKVLIPEEFNGKPVVGINSSIFAETSIDDICLQSKQKLPIISQWDLSSNFNSNLRIGVDKELIDAYRQDNIEKSLQFANNLYPCNLADDETYITFAYDNYDSLVQLVPTWIGKKGETFDMSYADNVEFFKHMDQSDVADLIWCWENNNAKVLRGFKDSKGYFLQGLKVNDSIQKVAVEFDSVFKATVEEDNDDLYEPSDDFKTTKLDGKSYDNRFVTVNTVDDMTAELQREGFNLTWNYRSQHDYIDLESLRPVLENEESNYYNRNSKKSFKIQPVWELRGATDLLISANQDSYVYGDDVKLSASAKAPNADCVLEYRWGIMLFDQSYKGKDYVMTNVHPDQSGTYYLNVIASSDKTSLTSREMISKDIVINKKSLNITWYPPEDMVFDGQTKTLTFSSGAGELINNDNLGSEYATADNLTNTNAGNYVASITLKNGLEEKYQIVVGGNYSYAILPRPVEAVWTVGDYVYNGSNQGPAVDAKDINGMSLELLLVNFNKINAGRYTAIVTSADTNYKISNPTHVYEIQKKSASVSWGALNLVYSGSGQHPSVASLVGMVQGDDKVLSTLIYRGYETNVNAGEGYKVTVELPANSNYKFDTLQSTVYNISKRVITAQWNSARTFAYNGREQNATVSSFSNIVQSDAQSVISSLIYSGKEINAGSNYTTTAQLSQQASANYEALGMSCNFSIDKREIFAVWGETNFVYDGLSHIPSVVSLQNVVEQDRAEVVGGLKYTGAKVNAGENYIATAVLSDNSQRNYKLTNSTCKFNIEKAQANAVWSEVAVKDGKVIPPALVISGTAYDGEVSVVRYTYRNSDGQIVSSIPAANGVYTIYVEISSDNFKLSGLQKTFNVSGISGGAKEVA